jgi:hypothetical protein
MLVAYLKNNLYIKIKTPALMKLSVPEMQKRQNPSPLYAE